MATLGASRHILGTRVDPTSYNEAADIIADWAAHNLSKYVCVATVSQVMEGHDEPAFQAVMNEADLVTPDGMPLVWGSNRAAAHRSRHCIRNYPDMAARSNRGAQCSCSIMDADWAEHQRARKH